MWWRKGVTTFGDPVIHLLLDVVEEGSYKCGDPVIHLLLDVVEEGS